MNFHPSLQQGSHSYNQWTRCKVKTAIADKKAPNAITQRTFQMTALQNANGEVALLIGFVQGPLHLPILNTARPEHTALATSTAITQTRAPSSRAVSAMPTLVM
jgi:hypothetical protein